MTDVRLLDGERLLHTSKANAVIFPSDYGLSRFAADDLLPLAGLAGREAIGGHLFVTSLRVVFVAHRFNRLKGSASIPLTAIEDARTWRSGLAIGVEIVTRLASFNYVSWSRSRVLRAISDARRALGPDQEGQIAAVNQSLEGFEVRRAAETLNIAARNLFDIAGAKPRALRLIGLLNVQGFGQGRSMWRSAQTMLGSRAAAQTADQASLSEKSARRTSELFGRGSRLATRRVLHVSGLPRRSPLRTRLHRSSLLSTAIEN